MPVEIIQTHIPSHDAHPLGTNGELEFCAPLAKCYADVIRLIERLNARLLDVVKDELDRHGGREINNVQALLLFHLDDRQLTAGELRARGCYLGSNVTHNLKKLAEGGYVRQDRCAADHRAVLVSLAPKGERIRDMIANLVERHLQSLEVVGDINAHDLATANTILKRLERYWIDNVRFRL